MDEHIDTTLRVYEYGTECEKRDRPVAPGIRFQLATGKFWRILGLSGKSDDPRTWHFVSR